MDISEMRPVFSGILGAAIAGLLSVWWAKWLPQGRGGKDPGILQLQYRHGIWLSNTAFLVGIFGTLALYQWGGYRSNDWRPAALGGGIALVSPLVILPLFALMRRGSTLEAFEAFAISQKVPVVVLYPLLSMGIPLLILALWASPISTDTFDRYDDTIGGITWHGNEEHLRKNLSAKRSSWRASQGLLRPA